MIEDFQFRHAIADGSYDSDAFIGQILAAQAVPVIPSRATRLAPRELDRSLYRERHLIECFINKIKQYRRVFSRFDKLDTRYLGFLAFVAALIWLR